MDSLFWQMVAQTSETEFIFGLFHLLLACLTLLVAFRLLRDKSQAPARGQSPLIFGFALFALAFAFTTVCSGGEFFFDKQWSRLSYGKLSHTLAMGACLLVSAGLILSEIRSASFSVIRWAKWGCLGIAGLLTADLLLGSETFLEGWALHSPVMLGADAGSSFAVGAAALLLALKRRKWTDPPTWALSLLLASLTAHFLHLAWISVWSAAWWHAEQHLLSLSLFMFAWTLGERSKGLFERLFVRLNLTLIILASITILSSVAMQRFQYLKLAEERSLNLAEFLRGHVIYYQDRGDDLETILQYPGVLRRIVVGLGELPDFRRVEIFLGDEQATFQYAADKTISREFTRAGGRQQRSAAASLEEFPRGAALFRMLRLPIYPEQDSADRIEFYGTLESIKRHLGRYILLVYFLFTVMAVAGIVILGVIVRNADRATQKQHEELEQVHRQLAQASKLASIGELAGGVAHEINNPVTSILSSASHLAGKRRDTSLSERDREELELITGQAERISVIVNKLLTFSRKSRMDLSLVDVTQVVSTALDLMEFRLRSGPVTVECHYADELPRVLGDRDRLTEVIVNLMNNALDAMPSGGVLSLRTAPTPQGEVRIEVADTGVGIDPALLSRIFDPFFTTKEPGKGTGLGLSISLAIVKDHHGEIRARSEHGSGSKFVVTLPRGASGNEETDLDR